jgi:hypothetical protein
MKQKSLADQILELARNGKIPVPFGVEDIRQHFADFRESHLRTVLSNYERNGDMVIRAKQPPRFVRVSEGRYKPL